MKQMLGHDGPPTNYWRTNLLTEAPLTRCPRRVELDALGGAAAGEVADARAFFPHYERGFLPEAGGIADQPALLLDLVGMLASTQRAVELKLEKLGRANADLGDGPSHGALPSLGG